MHFNLITLFPEMFPGPFGHSLAKQALNKAVWSFTTLNLREFGIGNHQTVDDRPFGGGAGMVIRPDVLAPAIDHVLGHSPHTQLIYLTPRGDIFNQPLAKRFVEDGDITLICGRYEGIDERILEAYPIQEVSIGDFILSGGEIAAYTVMDSCIRLLPGVIKNEEATQEESFGDDPKYQDLLEYPLYTRPALWNEKAVPEVLLSGNHQKIACWRQEQSQIITKKRRKIKKDTV